MTQSNHCQAKRCGFGYVLRSCVALAIAIAALSAPLAGCTSKKPALKAAKLSSEDKNQIATLMEFNCFFNYDSADPKNESTALFLTIGQMCGCWGLYVDDQDEEKKELFYVDDESKKYVKDPLKAFHPGNETGVAGYAKFDGETVDKLLKGIFNMEPTHDAAPKSFDCDVYYETHDSGASLKYYYYKGYYYAEETYGICGNEGYGLSFDDVVTDGTDYYIRYKRQYATWLDEITQSNFESAEINNPIDTAYATVRKNTVDGRQYWSIVKLSNEPYFDFSPYRKDKPDGNWQKLYIKQIQQYNKEIPESVFSLAFIDSDDIPELIEESNSTAAGGRVCTVYKDKLQTLDVGTYGVTYIDRQNSMLCGSGHMDNYYDDVYKIEKGAFTNTASGDYGLDEDFDYEKISDDDVRKYYTYYWEGKKVAKDQYFRNLNNVFDTSLATSPYKKTLSASTIIYRLNNGFYEVYPVHEEEYN